MKRLTDSRIKRLMREYRQEIGECELCRYLGIDRCPPTCTHHIRGGNVRGRVEANQTCNYLAICDEAHDWVHENKSAGEIVCWYAKWEKQCRRLPMDECDIPNDWEPSTIDCICDGGGLSGRISGILIPRIEEFGGDDAGKYLKMANELLLALGE